MSNVNIPILVKRVLSKVPKFYLFLVKYIDQVSDFDMNHKKKIIWTFVKLQKFFTLTTKIKQCYKLLKLNKKYTLTYYRNIFHIYCEYIYNYYIAIALFLRGIRNNKSFSEMIICV